MHDENASLTWEPQMKLDDIKDAIRLHRQIQPTGAFYGVTHYGAADLYDLGLPVIIVPDIEKQADAVNLFLRVTGGGESVILCYPDGGRYLHEGKLEAHMFASPPLSYRIIWFSRYEVDPPALPRTQERVGVPS